MRFMMRGQSRRDGGKRLNLFLSCVTLKSYINKEGDASMERTKENRARKVAAIACGGAMYALFASFGWQAQHLGQCKPGSALLVLAILFLPACLLLSFLFGLGERRAKRKEETGSFSAFRAFWMILIC